MERKTKKVLAIHDLSCFGRCALTVVLPTLSRFGIQAIPLPTALLSTHTGGFDNMFFQDMTDQMLEISNHLATLDISLDAVYSGFLGSARQIHAVEKILADLATPTTLCLVDPVMGDDGKLYSTYDDELVAGIRHLAKKAHILTPNLTEACLLAGVEYPDISLLSTTEIKAKLKELSLKLSEESPCADISITGIPTEEKMLTVSFSKDGTFHEHETDLCPISFPGTGDLFSSLLLCAVMEGKSFHDAVEYAAQNTTESVRISQGVDEPTRNGVLLEKFLRDGILEI